MSDRQLSAGEKLEYRRLKGIAKRLEAGTGASSAAEGAEADSEGRSRCRSKRQEAADGGGESAPQPAPSTPPIRTVGAVGSPSPPPSAGLNSSN
eukprot:7700271-Pyramimonas_sp.AAC.1